MVTAAFYYPIPQGRRLPNASQTPSGTKLDAIQIQQLLDGEIYEYTYSKSIQGNVNRHLVDAYAATRRTAMQDYQSAYSEIGDTWDGSNWN